MVRLGRTPRAANSRRSGSDAAPGGGPGGPGDGRSRTAGHEEEREFGLVTVTNRTDHRLGHQDVTLTLGSGGLKWLGYHNLYTSRDGGREAFACDLVPDHPGEAVCKDVDLDLAPERPASCARSSAGTPR